MLHDSGLLLNPSGHFRHLYNELPGLDAGPIYTKKSCGTATRSETLSLAATLVQVNEAVSTRSEFDAVGPVSSSLKRLSSSDAAILYDIDDIAVSGDVISTAVCVAVYAVVKDW
jgi:hypothetical protein